MAVNQLYPYTRTLGIYGLLRNHKSTLGHKKSTVTKTLTAGKIRKLVKSLWTLHKNSGQHQCAFQLIFAHSATVPSVSQRGQELTGIGWGLNSSSPHLSPPLSLSSPTGTLPATINRVCLRLSLCCHRNHTQHTAQLQASSLRCIIHTWTLIQHQGSPLGQTGVFEQHFAVKESCSESCNDQTWHVSERNLLYVTSWNQTTGHHCIRHSLTAPCLTHSLFD